MDHLHFEETSQLPPPQIHYVEPSGPFRYNNESFKNVAERFENISTTVSQTPEVFLTNTTGSAYGRYAATNLFIQEWLFFGILGEFAQIFGIPFQRQDFIQETAGGLSLSTQQLPDFAERLLSTKELHIQEVVAKAKLSHSTEAYTVPYKQSRPQNMEEAEENMLTRACDCLSAASSFLNALYAAAWKNDDLDFSFSLNSWLCSRILCESLTSILTTAFANGTRADDSLQNDPELDDYYLERFIAAGVCPTRGHNAMCGTVTNAYLASSLVHAGCDDHSGCTLSKCFVKLPSNRAELPKHRPMPECEGSCQSVKIEGSVTEAIQLILEQGSFPMLTVERTSELVNVQIRVVSWSSTKEPYVAISHVWAQGLGNPQENAIPSCQLLFILEKISKIPGSPVYFWIDTLCVPLGRNHRRLAIARMRATYKEAHAVLAMDDALFTVSSNILDRAYRLLLSTWMQRLWTFQEALLGEDRLFIAFGSDIINAGAFVDEIYDSRFCGPLKFRLINDHVGVSLLSRFKVRSGVSRLLDIASNMHERDTTHIKDEPLCLATLLDVDLLELPKLPDLPDVFSKLRTFPQDIVFAKGKRSDRIGFRWCPISLLNKPYPRKQYSWFLEAPMGAITDRGLRISKHGISFSEPFLFERRDKDTEQQRRFIVKDKSGAIICVFLYGGGEWPELHEQLRPRNLNKGSLIFEKMFDDSTNYSSVILVSETKLYQDVFYCRFEAILTAVYPEHYLERDHLDDKEHINVSGSWLETHHWCID